MSSATRHSALAPARPRPRLRRTLGKFRHPDEPLGSDVSQPGHGGAHRWFVALGRGDARGIEGTAISPRGDVWFSAILTRRPGSPDLHLCPVGWVVRKIVGWTQPVALPIVVAGCFDVPGQRCAEAREAGPDRLEPYFVGTPDRDHGWVLQSGGSAVHYECPRGQANGSVVQDQLAFGHVLNVTQANYIFDATKQIELPDAQGRCFRHRGDDGGIDPEHHTGSFEAQEHLIERLSVGGCNHDVS